MIELIFSLFLLTFSVILFNVSKDLPDKSLIQGGGAGFYPRFLLIVIMFLTVIYIIQNRKKIFGIKKELQGVSIKHLILENKYWLAFVAILFLVPSMIEYLGFRITGLVVMIADAVIIKMKNKTFKYKDMFLIMIIAFIVVFGISVVFENCLKFPLPKFKLF
jgi:cell division protein FtsL